MEPKYITHETHIGTVAVDLKCENLGGELLDTSVNIKAGRICCITWQDKDAFIKELNAVIDKYRI